MGVVTALLALLGPKLIGGLVAVVAALVGLIKYRSSIIKAERAKQKAKEIDAYEKHLQDIADAGNARPHWPRVRRPVQPRQVRPSARSGSR